jgi:hypothetical protein
VKTEQVKTTAIKSKQITCNNVHMKIPFSPTIINNQMKKIFVMFERKNEEEKARNKKILS